MNLEAIGKRIKEKRVAKHWRQEDLAEMTELTSSYIGLIERGKKCPSLETFVIIANALDVSADDLLSDVINNGYVMRMSKYLEKMNELNESHQKMLCDIMQIFFQNQ